jgi:O-methyltransferase
MIGDVRLASLHTCIVDVLESGVPGDLLEAGVWRGGASILMRGILKAHRSDRTVWVADSFAGLPPPTPSLYPADEGDEHWRNASLAVSLDEVKRNFDKYGLLDDQVKFLVGWFHETLASAPIEQLAILRLDGDMYQSTMDGLRNLYPLLAPGGYLIVDDYGAIPACKQAVLDYRKEFDITEEIVPIDWTGILWQRRQ